MSGKRILDSCCALLLHATNSQYHTSTNFNERREMKEGSTAKVCSQELLEPGDHYQMKHTIETKLQLLLQRIVSSSVYYLIFMWLLRIVVFILFIGKWFLIWFLRLSFLLIREGIRRYLGAAVVGLTLLQQPQERQKVQENEESSARSLEWAEDEVEETTSPLLPMVVKDRVRICEENLAIQDRERLLYEFDKIVAPQVSAFQLGEIIVPIDDTRQLATFLKSKLSQTCKSQSSEVINAAICGSILNIRAKGAISEFVESWERDGNIKHVVVYIAAELRGDDNIHLVLVGRKVEDFLGSSEYRTRFNPPRTRRDKQEWQTWTLAHLRSLKESVIDTAEELLSLGPVRAQVW